MLHHLRRAISGDFLVLAAGAAAVAVASIWAPPTNATSALVISASMKYSAICTSLTPRSSSSCGTGTCGKVSLYIFKPCVPRVRPCVCGVSLP